MEMRSGYNLTEVGVIPGDWPVKRIAEFTSCLAGGTPSTLVPSYWGGSIKWMSSGELHLKRVEDVADRITDDGLRNSAAKILPKKCVLVGLAGQGKTRGTVAVNLTELSTNQSIGAILPSAAFVPEYLFYNLDRRYDELREMSSGGGGRGGLNLKLIGSISIPLPSFPEQRAIATALSDVDALLGGLDRLIAKKRDLKQAAMQQLLTGQMRLPGFSGEWEVKRLGDHVTFLRNGVNPRAELLPEGRVKYLHYGDIHAITDSFLSPQTLPSLPDAKAAGLDRMRDGDVIFADASEDIAGVCKSVELRGARATEVVSGLHTIAARFDKAVLADGFKGYLQHCPSFATHLRRLAAGTKVYATNRAHIASVEMRLPSVAEQTAIAAVLSDMDAELATLEARRDKTRDLKQAMMQELLTGKTRLV